jgi:hypothetical protein
MAKTSSRLTSLAWLSQPVTSPLISSSSTEMGTRTMAEGKAAEEREEVRRMCNNPCLSKRKTWETAWPVAWDSVQLSQAKKNYPMHEKEMLTIVWALKRFHPELLRTHFSVYTDHQTLECFQGQWDLSRRQAR